MEQRLGLIKKRIKLGIRFMETISIKNVIMIQKLRVLKYNELKFIINRIIKLLNQLGRKKVYIDKLSTSINCNLSKQRQSNC